MEKLNHHSRCESYHHSHVIPMKKAKKIYENVCKVYLEKEDMFDFIYKSKMFQAKQKIGDEIVLIVVRIHYNWWTPWKGSVTEEAYFLNKD